MRFVRNIIFLFLFTTLSGWAQSKSSDTTYPIPQSKYLLTAYLASGEVITTTGRIVRTIALSHPRSMEIAKIWLNYNVNIKLKTDPIGESIAVVSFSSLNLIGDLDYKGFDVSDHIFPSLVSFKLINSGTFKEVLATVKAVSINPNDCTISISLPQNTKEIPDIDQLAFYHSDQDFEKADNHLKLIDRYYAAVWLMQRTNKLLDELQLTLLHNPSSFIAKNLEVIVITDWLTRQHFNRYPVFQKKDSLELIKNLEISRYRKNLIDQVFIRQNVISNEDLLKAATLFADNLAYYFDSNQPDYNRETYLTQMAESQLSTIGYNSIREFVQSYAVAHKLPDYDGQLVQKISGLIRYAMTEKATQLVDNEKYSEAMSMLNASNKYNLQRGTGRSQVDSLLTGKLIQRLYNAYLDFAIKSIKSGIYSITDDYYQKAILLEQTYNGLISPDNRERYLANMICKAMLESAEKSLKSNDTPAALATFEKVIHMAESARLKANYETAMARLEAISNRPSGYKPWTGDDLAIEIPDQVNNMTDLNDPNTNETNTRASNETTGISSSRRRGNGIASVKSGKASRNKLSKNAKTQSGMADPSQTGPAVDEVSLEVKKLQQQILDDIQNIHLKIWAGDTIGPVAMLHKTDSLQQLLALSGDHSQEARIHDLKTSLEDKRCDYQKSAYQKELEQIHRLVASKDINIAAKQLQLLIEKTYIVPCKVDKSEAISLLATLENPLIYNKQILQLDSITLTQEPATVIAAFEKSNAFYRVNMIEKFGIEPPDLMAALKSRKETSFLLQAVSLMLDNHRPANALELLKEINKVEPKPDLTISLQKRLGAMLASGDHAVTKTATDMLNTYNLNGRWYKELISAYKKQWKLF
jgi:hypothetical protein